MDSPIPLRVERIHQEALDVKVFDLVHAEGRPLPAAEAGAHIEVQLPGSLQRSYSLCQAPGDTGRYRIAVHRHPDSRGGSRHLHEGVVAGDVLLASPPRNHFPLHEQAGHSCLIAGGIGITPLLSMIHRLEALGRSWELHYAARTRDHAAFVEELQALAQVHGRTCRFHFHREPGSTRLDIAALVASLPAHTHLYCCGPATMLEGFEAATSHCPERSHREYFGGGGEAATTGGFTIELARSGLTLAVPPGASILDVVLGAGIAVPTSCREGICGSCETRILSGQADHRDKLLSTEEQQHNQSMMICCSGARTDRLVLDL